MSRQEIYGFPAPLPLDVMFVTFSNEDFGFDDALVTGTNENTQFALPMPASLDTDREAIVVFALEFINMGVSSNLLTTTAVSGLDVYLSALDKEFGATFRGVLDDTEDEAWKSKFGGPLYFGTDLATITAAASVEGTQRKTDAEVSALYFPPVPLDLVDPLFITFVNKSSDIVLATNATTFRDFNTFERVSIRTWYVKRQLTRAEMGDRAVMNRFQRLES